VTAPPLKATPSAGPSPPRAASAVRTLARTDTFIPMNPAAADATAPMRNPIAAFQPSRLESTACPSRAITTNSTTATPAMIVYCRRRYAWAPSWMAAAIDRIRSLPAGFRSTCTIRPTPYSTAMTPATTASQTVLSARNSAIVPSGIG